ncbi:hypothetical protein EV401DRAFT_2151926 [Pisolithus croceorrhizus]|nr:hypothetical protein EV401DRAFT_2151926 [Pisolithus croceorrhizus]
MYLSKNGAIYSDLVGVIHEPKGYPAHEAFSHHPASQYQFVPNLINVTESTYLQELQCLASEGSGWHFKASCTSTKQLEDFNLREMAQKMEVSTPKWWSLLGTLLGDKGTRESGVQRDDWGDEHAAMDMEGNLGSYWDDVDEIDLEGLINELTGEQESSPLVRDRHSRCCSGIKMMKANMLQSLLGLFLQSVHTPYKVIDTLTHLGITISANTINMAIQALSVESQNSL